MSKRILGVFMALGMAAGLSACDTMVGRGADSAWNWTTDAASATADFVTSPFSDDDEMSE